MTYIVLKAPLNSNQSINQSETFSCAWLILQMNHISINDFIELMTSDTGPPCLLWLPILQRLAAVENGSIFECFICIIN